MIYNWKIVKHPFNILVLVCRHYKQVLNKRFVNPQQLRTVDWYHNTTLHNNERCIPIMLSCRLEELRKSITTSRVFDCREACDYIGPSKRQDGLTLDSRKHSLLHSSDVLVRYVNPLVTSHSNIF